MARAIRFVPPLARNQQYHRQIHDLVPPPVVVNSVSKNILPDTTETTDPGPAPDPSEHIAALIRDAVSKPTVMPVTYAIPENIGDRISRLAPPKPLNQVVFAPKLPQPDPNWIAAQKVAPEHPALDESTQVEDSLDSVIASSSVVAQTPEILEEMPASETQESTVPKTDTQVDEAPDSVVAETATVALEAPPAEATPDRDELATSSETEAIAPVVAPEDSSLEEIPSQEPTVENSTSDVEQTASLAAETFTTEVQPADETEIHATEKEASVPETLPLEQNATEENSTEVTLGSSLESTVSAPVAPETSVVEETHSQALELEQSTETEVLPQLETPAPVESQQVSSPTEETKANSESFSSSSPEVTYPEISVQPTISDSEEETQIKCPACDSTELRKNGHRKDKQRYICKDCGKQFVEPDAIAAKNQPSSNQKSATKTSEVNKTQSVNGVGDRASKSTSNQGKTNKKSKGFGTRKNKK
jgi:transposase-like protein